MAECRRAGFEGHPGIRQRVEASRCVEVTWPNRKQVEGTTAVVILSVFAFAAYFAVVDQHPHQERYQRQSSKFFAK